MCTDKCQDCRLLVLVCAQRSKGIGARPKAAASHAFAGRRRFDPDRFQRPITPRAIADVFVLKYFDAAGLSSTMIAKLCAEKHQPEAAGAGYGFQPRGAELALRLVARNRSAAIWTIKCFDCHRTSLNGQPLFDRCTHFAYRSFQAGPDPELLRALGDQHVESADNRNTGRFRLSHQARFCWIVD